MKKAITKTALTAVIKQVTPDYNNEVLQTLFNQFDEKFLVDRCLEDLIKSRQTSSLPKQVIKECVQKLLLALLKMEQNGRVQTKTKNRTRREDTGRPDQVANES